MDSFRDNWTSNENDNDFLDAFDFKKCDSITKLAKLFFEIMGYRYVYTKSGKLIKCCDGRWTNVGRLNAIDKDIEVSLIPLFAYKIRQLQKMEKYKEIKGLEEMIEKLGTAWADGIVVKVKQMVMTRCLIKENTCEALLK